MTVSRGIRAGEGKVCWAPPGQSHRCRVLLLSSALQPVPEQQRRLGQHWVPLRSQGQGQGSFPGTITFVANQNSYNSSASSLYSHLWGEGCKSGTTSAQHFRKFLNHVLEHFPCLTESSFKSIAGGLCFLYRDRVIIRHG